LEQRALVDREALLEVLALVGGGVAAVAVGGVAGSVEIDHDDVIPP
jgi:hypothetical protein